MQHDKQRIDMSDEGSRRPEGEGATTVSRQMDSNHSTEETWDSPDNDGTITPDNKVPTSLDEE